MLQELYPADGAELFQELDLEEAIYLYMLYGWKKAADVLMELDEEDRRKLEGAAQQADCQTLYRLHAGPTMQLT